MSAISENFADFSAVQVRNGLIAKEFSAAQVAKSAIARVRECDTHVNAFLEITEDLAYSQAKMIDDMIAEGRAQELPILAGTVSGFKDNMNLVGTKTTCSSKLLENYTSPYTATCVSKMLSAGVIPMGKLNMDEFAFGSSTETSAFGPSKNPWDLTRVPGGSSGGSVAAVAAGMAGITLGSDTGGSIRQPGSFCGCVAVKPTYGMVSRYGVVAFGSSLDQVGPFTHSVHDAALSMNALVGLDSLDSTSQDCECDFTANLDQGVDGMKIGIVPAFMDAAGLDAEVKQAVLDSARKLEAQGAQIVEVELPNAAAAMSAYYVLGPCEAFSNLARFDAVRYGLRDTEACDLNTMYENSRAAGFGKEAQRRILLGAYLLSAGVYDKYYYPAQQVRTLITEDYVNAFSKVDAILAPVAPRTAFKFGEIADPTSMYLSDMFTISINIAGNCAMSLPVGLGADSQMPIGAQIIGPSFGDATMLRVAAALERSIIAEGVAAHGETAPDFACGKLPVLGNEKVSTSANGKAGA